MDQRKVNMLAREYCEFPDIKKKRKFKPIILSHHMLMGLKQGQAKMSKSDPDSAIFMEDEAVRYSANGCMHLGRIRNTYSCFSDYHADRIYYNRPTFRVKSAMHFVRRALSTAILASTM